MLISPRQRTMETLKAISNTWDNRHKGSHVNLSHMEHFFIFTAPSTFPIVSIVPPLLFLIWPWTMSTPSRPSWQTVHVRHRPQQKHNGLCCFPRCAPLFFTFQTPEDRLKNDHNQWKNGVRCFTAVDKLSLSSTGG